jgi:hypothetical protein
MLDHGDPDSKRNGQMRTKRARLMAILATCGAIITIGAAMYGSHTTVRSNLTAEGESAAATSGQGR